jgi:hypothetical protein
MCLLITNSLSSALIDLFAELMERFGRDCGDDKLSEMYEEGIGHRCIEIVTNFKATRPPETKPLSFGDEVPPFEKDPNLSEYENMVGWLCQHVHYNNSRAAAARTGPQRPQVWQLSVPLPALQITISIMRYPFRLQEYPGQPMCCGSSQSLYYCVWQQHFY